jgi:hypothetical protein
MAMFDSPQSPVSQTFGLGIFEPVTPDVLDRVEAFYFERGSPADHEISPIAGVDLTAALVERGYFPIEQSSVMYLPLPKEDCCAGSSPIQVRTVGDLDREVWVRTAAAGWGSANLEELMRISGSCEGLVAFLAEKEGRAVATGSLSIQGGVALLAGASTLPMDRRQGAQKALSYARLGYAAGAGCDLAMIVAEPGSESQRNAEREGFRIAYTRTKWRKIAK